MPQIRQTETDFAAEAAYAAYGKQPPKPPRQGKPATEGSAEFSEPTVDGDVTPAQRVQAWVTVGRLTKAQGYCLGMVIGNCLESEEFQLALVELMQ